MAGTRVEKKLTAIRVKLYTLLEVPRIKCGVIDLLDGKEPTRSGLTTRQFGFGTAALTLIGFALSFRSLWHRLRLGEPQPHNRAWWGIFRLARLFAPALMLLSLPWLIAYASGRAFSFSMLFKAILDLTFGLAFCGAVMMASGLIQIVRGARSP